MRRRLSFLLVAGVAIVVTPNGVGASEPAAVVVTNGGARVRVQLSEGLTTPCDSSNNRSLYDGWIAPGDTFRTSIGGDCVCVRHTTSTFPNAEWTTDGLKCRPRTCRNRVCRPAADPTIRLSIP